MKKIHTLKEEAFEIDIRMDDQSKWDFVVKKDPWVDVYGNRHYKTIIYVYEKFNENGQTRKTNVSSSCAI